MVRKERTRRGTRLLVGLLLVLLTVPAFAGRHRHASHKHSLFPTAGSLQEQNVEANRLHLPRINNDKELKVLIERGELVRIYPSPSLRVNIPANRAYLRPWANDFLQDLSDSFFWQFGKPLQVNSAVRTVQFQARLRSWNSNAAPAHGDTASVHPTGIAFDLQRHGLTRTQEMWLSWRLFYLSQRGSAIVEQERACYHVVVLSL